MQNPPILPLYTSAEPFFIVFCQFVCGEERFPILALLLEVGIRMGVSLST